MAQHVLGWDTARFLASETDPPPAEFERSYDALVARRQQREPLAYIIGVKEFWNLSFEVSPAVLIPRPETELLVEAALDRYPPASTIRIADVCTGSGCVAIALACERRGATVIATDISAEALLVARRNAERLQVETRVTFVETDLLAGIAGTFDLIVSNPPYVPEQDRATLQQEVREHEPAVALFAGHDGLSAIRRLAAESVAHLPAGGVLMFEFGAGQETAVDQVVAATTGLRMEGIKRDLKGIPRTAIATRTSSPQSAQST
jgi:release factor glutamine methyltransferase